MKLKTKLIIAFMIVMIFPIALTTAAIAIMRKPEIVELQQVFLLVVFMTSVLLMYCPPWPEAR